jgi:hypothetical protein
MGAGMQVLIAGEAGDIGMLGTPVCAVGSRGGVSTAVEDIWKSILRWWMKSTVG